MGQAPQISNDRITEDLKERKKKKRRREEDWGLEKPMWKGEDNVNYRKSIKEGKKERMQTAFDEPMWTGQLQK